MNYKIAIIGGGYTGLTAAYRLAKQGNQVVLYEKESQVGGLAVAFKLDGLSLEKIYHFIYVTDKDTFQLAEELGIRDLITFHESSVSIYYDGRLYPFITPIDLFRFKPLSFFNRIRLGIVGVYLPSVKNWERFKKIPAYRWLTRWAGKQATRIVWEPLLKGKFGKYYDKIAMCWLWTRIRVRATSKQKGESAERLGYLKGGFSVFTDRLATEIEQSAGKIVVNAPIESIMGQSDGSVTVKAGKSTDTFDSVISTTPTHVFSKMIERNKEVTEAYRHKLRSIKYIGAIVMVFTSNEDITPYYWHNINDPSIPFLVFLSNSALVGNESSVDKRVYYIGVYVPHDHPYFLVEGGQIMQEWEESLKRIFPGFHPSSIREKQLFKFKNAQHIVDVEYQDNIPPYESVVQNTYLANFSQIYPEDRGINYAIAEGNKIAELVSSNLNDRKKNIRDAA